jgi:Mn-dependent DtxR family transcriptional regulator
MEKLTPRQKDIVLYMKDFLKDNGHTVRMVDIKEHFGFSYQTCQFHIGALIKKGYVTKPKRGVLVLE